MNQNIGEANKAAPILWQAISPFVFHPDALTFLPIVPTGKYEWPDLPDCDETAHMAQALTKTAAPDTAILQLFGAAKEILQIIHDY